jgi:hypothetical protein
MAYRSCRLKYPLALKSIAARYVGVMRYGYRTDCLTVFLPRGDLVSDGHAPDWRAAGFPLWVTCKGK